MRTDLFQKHKCIHLKLSKETHSALRSKLFKYNVSMQAVMEEFAKLIVHGESRSISIVEDYIIKSVKEKLKIEVSPLQKTKEGICRSVDHGDNDILYTLIEEANNEKIKRGRMDEDGES